jgi:hypothetical protein
MMGMEEMQQHCGWTKSCTVQLKQRSNSMAHHQLRWKRLSRCAAALIATLLYLKFAEGEFGH